MLAWFGSSCALLDDDAPKRPPPGLIATPASYYSTAKARYLATKYKENLDRLTERIVRNSNTSQLQFANNLSSIGGIGFFTHSATKTADERYLEIVLSTPETFETKGEYSEKVNQLFSRYGHDLLAILAGDGQIFQDKELAGYGLNLTWRIVISDAPENRVSMARAIIYFDKEKVATFLRKDLSANDLLSDAVIFAVEENGPLNMVSYQPRETKPDFRPAIREDNLAPAVAAARSSQQPLSKSEPQAAKRLEAKADSSSKRELQEPAPSAAITATQSAEKSSLESAATAPQGRLAPSANAAVEKPLTAKVDDATEKVKLASERTETKSVKPVKGDAEAAKPQEKLATSKAAVPVPEIEDQAKAKNDALTAPKSPATKAEVRANQTNEAELRRQETPPATKGASGSAEMAEKQAPSTVASTPSNLTPPKRTDERNDEKIVTAPRPMDDKAATPAPSAANVENRKPVPPAAAKPTAQPAGKMIEAKEVPSAPESKTPMSAPQQVEAARAPAIANAPVPREPKPVAAPKDSSAEKQPVITDPAPTSSPAPVATIINKSAVERTPLPGVDATPVRASVEKPVAHVERKAGVPAVPETKLAQSKAPTAPSLPRSLEKQPELTAPPKPESSISDLASLPQAKHSEAKAVPASTQKVAEPSPARKIESPAPQATKLSQEKMADLAPVRTTEKPAQIPAAVKTEKNTSEPVRLPELKAPQAAPRPTVEKVPDTPSVRKIESASEIKTEGVPTIKPAVNPPVAVAAQEPAEKPADEQLALLRRPSEPVVEKKPLARPAPKALEGFIIQIAFNDKEKAQSWAEKMQQRGYAVSITEAGAEGSLRVRLGNFAVREEAERQLRNFKQEGMSGIVINLPQAFQPVARSSMP